MPTVLIVDDEQHIRLLIEQTLEELEDDGVDLLTAADGEQCLLIAAAEQPDLLSSAWPSNSAMGRRCAG